MLKKILLNSLLLSTLISFSQDIVTSTPMPFKKNRSSFQVVNNEDKTTALFLIDKEKVSAIHLNEQMQTKDSLSALRPDVKKYLSLVGHNSTNSNIRLYWSSKDSKEIYSQLYDFNANKVTSQEYTLSLKDERVLKKFSKDNTFYLLTVVKKSDTFKLHIFDNSGRYEEKIIELKNFHFYTSMYKKTNLYGVLEENLLPFEPPFSLIRITPENLTSITEAAFKRKCYFDGKEIVITIDSNIDYTQAIIIDLENYTATEKLLKQTIIQTEFRSEVNSNSFYFDKKMYQIKTSSDRFYLNIKDLNDNVLKEYTATSAKPIEFKNSDINQENSGGAKRVLENSSQFIRKLNNQHSALSCYHLGENTLITIGSVSQEGNGPGAQAVFAQLGLVGALITIATSSPMESFNSYSNRKVVKIEGLFDKDDNHVKGDLQPLAFDKIRTFFEKNNDISAETLFKMGDFYYVAYYDNKAKEYTIRKFAD